jgi:hypothetical protein
MNLLKSFRIFKSLTNPPPMIATLSTDFFPSDSDIVIIYRWDLLKFVFQKQYKLQKYFSKAIQKYFSNNWIALPEWSDPTNRLTSPPAAIYA